MSKTGKITLWVVLAVIVIGGGIWWWVASRSNSMPPSVGLNETSSAPSTVSGSANGTASTTASTSYPQGDSDQSISQDMASLNTQVNGLNSDNASVTQSMNDQPVQQGE